MAKFIVRIELHDAEKGTNTYDNLHEQMKLSGFKKTISDGKVEKQLPTGTYFIDSTTTTQQISQSAASAAKKALQDSGLTSIPALVTAEVNGLLIFSGLQDN